MPDEIEIQILKMFDKLPGSIRREEALSSTEWSKRVKDGLSALGKENGYAIAADHCDGADTAEWIFHLVWAYVQHSPWKFLEMTLAMQCEWSIHPEDIAWRFEKLLIAKATHKLMVFQQPSESGFRGVIERLTTMAVDFRPGFPGERYLFACYASDEHKFFHDLIEF